MKSGWCKTVSSLVASCVLGVLISGCAWSIGEKHAEAGPGNKPTRGQELIDLKKARDTGAITPDEYEAQKQKLLEK